MLNRILAVVLLGSVMALAQAAEPAPAGKLSTENIIKHALEGRLGGVKVDTVTKTPYLGLYEVRVGTEIIYTDAKMTYIFSGNIIDAKTMQNLTQKRMNELNAIKWDDLPLDAAFKTVHGNGKRLLAVFVDPNCPYCKRFEKDLAKVDDITVYTFLFPILSQDSKQKAQAIWCSADKSKAWNDLMLNGKVPAAASCNTPIEENMQFARKNNITGTPTLVFANGERVPGAVSAEQLEKMLALNDKK